MLVSIPGTQLEKTLKLGKLWGFFIFAVIFSIICSGPFQLHNVSRKTSEFILHPLGFCCCCFDLLFVFEDSKIDQLERQKPTLNLGPDDSMPVECVLPGLVLG